MALAFRNLDVSPDAPVEDWGFEGLLAAVDRGDLTDWRRWRPPLLAPRGDVADLLAKGSRPRRTPAPWVRFAPTCVVGRRAARERSLTKPRRSLDELRALSARLGAERDRVCPAPRDVPDQVQRLLNRRTVPFAEPSPRPCLARHGAVVSTSRARGVASRLQEVLRE